MEGRVSSPFALVHVVPVVHGESTDPLPHVRCVISVFATMFYLCRVRVGEIGATAVWQSYQNNYQNLHNKVLPTKHDNLPLMELNSILYSLLSNEISRSHQQLLPAPHAHY